MADAELDGMAGRPVGDLLAGHGHAAVAGSQSRHDLGQLALTIAGDSRDAHDLAGAHLQRDAAQGRQASVVVGLDVAHREHDPARSIRGSLDGLEHLAADHPTSQVRRGRIGDRDPLCGDLAPPHDRDPVRDGHHLVELVADEHDAPAIGGHRAEGSEELVHLLWREDGRRLIHDQDPRAAVEHLEDLDPLLFADRQLPDLGPGIDAQPELRGELGNLLLGASRLEPEPRTIEPEQDVLGHGLRRHQREVLVDHPDPGRDRGPW